MKDGTRSVSRSGMACDDGLGLRSQRTPTQADPRLYRGQDRGEGACGAMVRAGLANSASASSGDLIDAGGVRKVGEAVGMLEIRAATCRCQEQT